MALTGQNNKTLQLLPKTMQAMVLRAPGQRLVNTTLAMPVPSPVQVLVKIMACGVCRTDLHITDGELPDPKLPLIMGHEIIGTVVGVGSEVTKLQVGDIVGIPWVAYTCGACKYCLRQQENLCERALFTGYTQNGGYAEYTVAFENFCFPLPAGYGKPASAPLLCAGLIGYRSYSMIGKDAERIGFYGFGAAAHILVQIAIYQGKKVYAFTRDGDTEAQAFATSLGAVWAGGSSTQPTEKMDAAIIFAPAGPLVVKALQDTDKGGSIICAGIHMSEIPSFPYNLLWGEKMIRSVANLTRKDGQEFLSLAMKLAIKTTTQSFALLAANEALEALRNGQIQGAAVLTM